MLLIFKNNILIGITKSRDFIPFDDADVYDAPESFNYKDNSAIIVNNIVVVIDIKDAEVFLGNDVLIKNIENQVNEIIVPLPYFQQAAKILVFAKGNTKSYPNTMTSLRTQDDLLILNGAYNGLSEVDKSLLLIESTVLDLDITI